ncbi:MAG: nucleoside triphosphate pyrophosphohydrolase [Gammaproteobacteria bacterium]
MNQQETTMSDTQQKALENIRQLLIFMRQLRTSPEGCAWTQAQTLASLVPYSLEETYELITAIETGDYAAVCSELGDLLYQIVFYAQMAEEQGLFSFADVAGSMLHKHEQRRPQASSVGLSAEQVRQQWDAIKLQQRLASQSLLADIVPNLPALMHATKLQQRAALVGFDWCTIQPVFNKLKEEIAELEQAIANAHSVTPTAEQLNHIGEELGDVLFCSANIARHFALDAETILRQANQKFIRRFTYIEQALKQQGRTLTEASLDDMEALWQQAKQVEKR